MNDSIVQNRVLDYLDEEETVVLWDGMERAIIGVARQFGVPFVVYDRTRCIEILMEQGMSFIDAEEYFAFNVEGGWLGSATPLVLEFPDD